jgi:uncharacterized protein (DUF4415 family)
MKKQSRTEWERIDHMPEQRIDYAESPKLDDDFFKDAVIWPGNKKQITLRLDQDILEFFKGQGKGYQRNINTVLRRYMQTQKKKIA